MKEELENELRTLVEGIRLVIRDLDDQRDLELSCKLLQELRNWAGSKTKVEELTRKQQSEM